MTTFHLLTDILHFVSSDWLLLGPHRTRKHLKDEQIVKNQFSTLANGNNSVVVRNLFYLLTVMSYIKLSLTLRYICDWNHWRVLFQGLMKELYPSCAISDKVQITLSLTLSQSECWCPSFLTKMRFPSH